MIDCSEPPIPSGLGPDGRGSPRSFSGENVDLDHPEQEFIPTVFLYDNYPGGIGLSAPLYDMQRQLVARARALVAACECRRGCPACVGPILSSDETRGSPRQAALRVLALIACGDGPEDQGSMA